MDFVRQKERKHVQNNSFKHKRRSVENTFTQKSIETLIVADYSVYKEFEKLNESLETYLLSVFNMVSMIYKDPSLGNPIKFSLVRLIIIQNETVYMLSIVFVSLAYSLMVVLIFFIDNKKSDLLVDSKPTDTLKRFSVYQKNLNFPDEHPLHHDLAVLVTQ